MYLFFRLYDFPDVVNCIFYLIFWFPLRNILYNRNLPGITATCYSLLEAKLRVDMPGKCQWWVVTFSPQSDGNNGSKVGAGHQVCSWSGSWHEKVSYKKRSG